jgi:3'-phosphoadenosine 5'-phosphosulfate (PAPS) 3'-phosphatase
MTELNNDPYGSGEFSINPEDFVFLQGLLIQGGTMMLPRILGHDFETEWKPDNTPVTTVDLGLADFYNTALHSRHPNDRIYNEEGGVEPEGEFSGNTWVVDPTDGTQSLEQASMQSLVALPVLALMVRRSMPLSTILSKTNSLQLCAVCRPL